MLVLSVKMLDLYKNLNLFNKHISLIKLYSEESKLQNTVPKKHYAQKLSFLFFSKSMHTKTTLFIVVISG